jgi:hypothetical protein
VAGFLELYCTGTGAGSNLNSGSTPGNAATYAGVGDSDGVAVFTPSDGSTPAGSVNVGDVGAVFLTAGATVATFVGRITAVAAGVNGAITFSAAAKVGTFPAASAGAHTVSCRVGGAWAGPAGAVAFPYGFVAGTLTDASGNTPRVNFLSTFTFLPTAVMAHAAAGPVQFEAYATTPGDGGRATFDGGEPAASFNLLTNSGANNTFESLIFQRNGSTGTGTAAGVVNTGAGTVFRRCTFNTTRGAGLTLGAALAVECEFYACNAGNAVNQGGLTLNNGGGVARRCYSRSQAGSNNAGYALTASGGVLEHCVADGCQVGANLVGAGPYNVVHLDTYNNTSHGMQLGATGVNCTIYAENGGHCNNGGTNVFGFAGGGTKSGWVVNVAHGSGTAASAAQASGLGAVKVINPITLPANVTPWSAPSTGNFNVVLPALVGAGLGTFTQTSPKGGTAGQPTVGAAGQAIALVPPTAAQVAAAVWADLLASADFGTAGSIGALLKLGNAPTAAQVAAAVWTDLLAGADFATAGSVGAKLLSLALLAGGRVDVGAWLGQPALLGPTTHLPQVDVEAVTDAPAVPLGAVPATLVSTGLDAVLADGRRVVDCIGRIFATTTGKVSGVGSGQESWVGPDGLTTRVIVTVDPLGNRTGVLYP